MSAAFALDLDIGIPITAQPTPRDLQRASDERYVGLDLFPYDGKGPRPPLWEERQWLSAYRRAGCNIECANGSRFFAYMMPGKTVDEGVRLLAWLRDAEKRSPGIGYRVHALAVNFEGVKVALEDMKARSGKPAGRAA